MRFWDVRSKTCVSRLDVGGEAFTLSWSADGNVVMVGRKVRRKDANFPLGIGKRLTNARMIQGRYSNPRLR